MEGKPDGDPGGNREMRIGGAGGGVGGGVDVEGTPRGRSSNSSSHATASLNRWVNTAREPGGIEVRTYTRIYIGLSVFCKCRSL